MPKTNRIFTADELEQTQRILYSSDFGSRPLVKGLTIDTQQSRDLDDAIWVETHGELGKLQIHIADPTAVIERDSPLDRGVRKRLETLYLAKGRKPMLPPALSEQKLSLLEGEPKLTLTVEIELNSRGEILHHQIFESCFVSVGKLSYQEAEQITNNPEHQLFLALNSAQSWAQILNRVRVKQGAFAGIIKGNFYLNEEGQIQPFSCRSEVLIAEYMILANTVIAQWLADKSLPGLYRNHLPKPELELNWSALESAEPQDFRTHYSHCLGKASYGHCCQGHLALATPYYLHFTSPLRRGADFIVHRIVKAFLAGQDCPYTQAEIKTIAAEINQFQLEQKVSKTNYLKEKRDKNLAQITNYSGLEGKDFSRVIELSIAQDSCDQIRKELEMRLLLGQLTNTDLSLILFQTEELELQQLIFNSLEDHRFVNLLHNCPQLLPEISHLEYEELIYKPKQLLFVSRLIVTLHNQDVTTPEPVKGKNKKDAKIQAYKSWLQAYLERQLVPTEQSSHLDIKTEMLQLEPEVIEFKHPSPAGTLHNLCQQRKWKKPRFEYAKKDGLFTCTATLHLDTTTLSTTSQTQKKRNAQNLAADLLLSELDSGDEDKLK